LQKHFMKKVNDDDKRLQDEPAKWTEQLIAMEMEFQENGTDEDKECFNYIVNERAGSSHVKFQDGLTRDIGRNGETLEDFVNLPACRDAKLLSHHVAALRLYTTAAYKTINDPLRKTVNRNPDDGFDKHPFPATVQCIADAIGQLRALEGADQERAYKNIDLWRGMRDLEVSDEFLNGGGTEMAVMSTTSALSVAVQYAKSANALLLKLSTTDFHSRGVNIAFLSAFPGEKEFLYPPRTFIRYKNKRLKMEIGETMYTVLEVEPKMPS